MKNQKRETVVAIWSYGSLSNYDGFDWIDVDNVAALCQDENENFHLYLDCYNKENESMYDWVQCYSNDSDSLYVSFDIGFNPIFLMNGLDKCVEDILNEYCLILELELADKEHCEDELDELDLWEVKSNVLKHMRNVVSLHDSYLIHEFPVEEGVPFRVYVNKIY